jgi:hypothetical protein
MSPAAGRSLTAGTIQMTKSMNQGTSEFHKHFSENYILLYRGRRELWHCSSSRNDICLEMASH